MRGTADSAYPDGLYWIDDLGQWHRVDPASPFAHLREPIAENQQGHAFRWLGMVRAVVKDDCLQVKWDVLHVEGGSLDAIESYVATSPHATVHLEFFHGGWNRESYTDSATAARRIRRTRGFRNVAFIAPLTVMRLSPDPRHPTRDDLLREDVPLTDRALAAWEASERIWSPERPLGWLAEHVLVMRPPHARTNAMLVHHVGERHAVVEVLGPDAAARIVGKLCRFSWLSQDQVRRLLLAYREVAQSGRPHLEDVRSLILPDGAEPAWVPYRRLLLPCHTETGEPVIACLSEVRQDISIPFMGEAA